jgi:hypothetical protein
MLRADLVSCPPSCADGRQLSPDEQRRGAEELLCILSVLDGILSQLPSMDSLDVRDMVTDLAMLINKTAYPVVSGFLVDYAVYKPVCRVFGVYHLHTGRLKGGEGRWLQLV